MTRTRQERLRLGLLFVLVCLFFGVVVTRLVHLQVLLSPKYSEIVNRQSSGKVPIPGSRGIIYDRNGRVVANNVTKSSLYAYPRDKAEMRHVAAYVERVLDLQKGTAVKRFGLEPKRFRWIKRMLDDDLAARIAADAPGGLFLRSETQRDYPFGLIGKQILGFADVDNCGKAGVELSFDSVLAGKNGFADIRRDGLRNTFRIEEQALVKPEPGESMVLTVDWSLQEIVEEELRFGVEKYKAKSGVAVFLNCNSGEVLAMAHFDPSEKNPDKPVKLRAVSDQFEPGSILKAFTAVGVIEDTILNYDDSIYCEDGAWKIGRRTLHDDKKHGWLKFRQVLELSSNIGIAKYAIMQGGERLLETLQSFGLGQKAGVSLPGETSGRLYKPSRWSDYNIAALAMGHSVTVNALQMANGFAAIANGGYLYQPHLVKGYVDKEGNLVNKSEPLVVNRVLQQTTADTLASILRGVVERGTAEVLNSSVVTMAGKTGTAQIPDPVNRCYSNSRYMASFAGFFPFEQPLVAGIIVYEEPQPVHYGGLTAGPSFKRIAESYSIMYPDLFSAPDRMLAETSDKFNNTVEVPNLIGRQLAQAKVMAEDHQLQLRCQESEGSVVWQFPAADRLAFEGDEVLVLVSSDSEAGKKMTDLRGLSIRQVSAFLKELGINFTISGNGRVVKQSINPGEILKENPVCRLECRPAAGGKHQAQRADRASTGRRDKGQS
ncbi:MAG: penicillin-binding transpeptidase domain-containing protein [Candidatus Zixiibacteriota bacterium]